MLYLRNNLFSLVTVDDLDSLHQALQGAISLKHATMPPYLYALYSISSGNAAARTALRAIVREEMLHMLLAANILTAVGGHPVIDDPDFVPHYPAPLPGTIENRLIVSLSPYSPALAEQVLSCRSRNQKRPLEPAPVMTGRDIPELACTSSYAVDVISPVLSMN